MNFEIDQSGKIENTSKNTVIAFSNKIFGSIFISAKDKREIQKIFRNAGKPRIFVYKLFTILIFLLIKKHLKDINQIIIDDEYPGKGYLIKNFLQQEFRKKNSDFSANNITIKRIGKKSRAHYLAYGVATGRKMPDKRVTIREILKFIVK